MTDTVSTWPLLGSIYVAIAQSGAKSHAFGAFVVVPDDPADGGPMERVRRFNTIGTPNAAVLRTIWWALDFAEARHRRVRVYTSLKAAAPEEAMIPSLAERVLFRDATPFEKGMKALARRLLGTKSEVVWMSSKAGDVHLGRASVLANAELLKAP